jgi:hypothetical protein
MSCIICVVAPLSLPEYTLRFGRRRRWYASGGLFCQKMDPQESWPFHNSATLENRVFSAVDGLITLDDARIEIEQGL